MAMFEKLFVKRSLDDVNLSRSRRSQELAPEQVRLLLFKECDWRGRRVLFDSVTVERVPSKKDDKPSVGGVTEAPYILEVANGYTYKYKGPAEDASVLGEMIFGAVAMNCKNVSLKIHIMDEPKRLMCTKVFCVPTPRPTSRKSSQGASPPAAPPDAPPDAPCDAPPSMTRNQTNPLRTLSKDEGMALSFSIERGDSGFCGEHSPHSSVCLSNDYFSMSDDWGGSAIQEDNYSLHSPSGRKLSTSSNGSWQRRTFQNMLTRFDLAGHSSNVLNVPAKGNTGSDSQIYSNSSASGTSDSLSSGSSLALQRRRKLGLALLITAPDPLHTAALRACLERAPQLQALVCRVRRAAAAARGSVQSLHAAASHAAQCVKDMLHGPRLQPMWLSLAAGGGGAGAGRRAALADGLVSELCAVLAAADTKDTNFFISTLMTHVLTYHLGWVTTVSPYDTVDVYKRPMEFLSAAKHSYNALWAQLTDLCGAIGYPPRASRTIISGSKNTQFLNRLLKVITYFLRCGEVKKNKCKFEPCDLNESKVVCVNRMGTLKRTATQSSRLDDVETQCLKVPSVNTQGSGSVNTLVASETGLKRSSTQANIGGKLSSDDALGLTTASSCSGALNKLRRNPTMLVDMQSSDTSLSSVTEESEPEQQVVFVLGDNEKLVGLKNKSSGGKRVKKSSKVSLEQTEPQVPSCAPEGCEATPDSKSKCCGQTLQHSKPIKHSGFKFEFDKYPQIVTNYMKSKNLEILDRHYIGKPGNLKLDKFQFDPTVVPPIQEERCETCTKCQLLEATLQTPTNASEMESLSDLPRHQEQFAREATVQDTDLHREVSPKTFVRMRKPNTIVVNVNQRVEKSVGRDKTVEENNKDDANAIKPNVPYSYDEIDAKFDLKRNSIIEQEEPNADESQNQYSLKPKDYSIGKIIPEIKTHEVPILTRLELRRAEKDRKESKLFEVKRVIELPPPRVSVAHDADADLQMSLFGGLTDHYVPDLVLQGTLARPKVWEMELRRDLELTTYVNKTLDSPVQAVAIVADTNTWEVRMVGRGVGAGGVSSLVGAILDALPAMRRANVPAIQCLSFIEGKLREICVLSKTLTDMLMSTDFCDIATLTRSLNIDINDVPLLMAVATTHTPQVATRYGISYR